MRLASFNVYIRFPDILDLEETLGQWLRAENTSVEYRYMWIRSESLKSFSIELRMSEDGEFPESEARIIGRILDMLRALGIDSVIVGFSLFLDSEEECQGKILLEEPILELLARYPTHFRIEFVTEPYKGD